MVEDSKNSLSTSMVEDVAITVSYQTLVAGGIKPQVYSSEVSLDWCTMPLQKFPFPSMKTALLLTKANSFVFTENVRDIKSRVF